MKYIFIVLALFSLVAVAEEWSVNYEKPVCSSSDSPEGDVSLVCTESNTVKNLTVQLSNTDLSGSSYVAVVGITNTNKYTVKVKTVLVDALGSNGQVIGFCSNAVSKVLHAEQSFDTKISCSFSGINSDSIASVKVRATPWS